MNTGIIFLTAGRLQVAKTTETNKQRRQTTDGTHRCPHCECVVYSRRFSICRDCGGELDGKTRLAPRQAALLGAEQKNARNRMQRLNSVLASTQAIWTLRI